MMQMLLQVIICGLLIFGIVAESESRPQPEEPLVYLTNSMTFNLNMGYCAYEIYARADTDVEITELKIALETVAQDPDSVEGKKKKEKMELVIGSVGGSSVNAYASGSVEVPCDTDGVFQVKAASGTIDGRVVDLTDRISSFDPTRVRIRTPIEEKNSSGTHLQSKR